MKLVNFKKNGKNVLGVLTERGVADVSASPVPGVPKTMMEALRMGREAALSALAPAVASAESFLPGEDIEYAPAVDAPEKILCVGRNYQAHVNEAPVLFDFTTTAPEIFTKFNNTLVPHRGYVRRNPLSKKHDYEAEIAVVIGRRASRVSMEEAMDYVFGYTLANDISARDLQRAATQWTPGKTCDTFCPLGPCVLTAEEVAYDNLNITGYKNGELRQSGCTRDMIYPIPYLIHFLSSCCTLEAGDVILTGTPAGVILGRPEGQQDWLISGDVLTVHVEEIGSLTVTLTDD